MEANQSPDEIYARLRRLVVSEPKDARADLAALLNNSSPLLRDVLERASRPGEGRMRQMIAMAARLSQTASNIEDQLRSWEVIEPDEFTRGAIATALESIRPAAPVTIRVFEMPEQFVEAYRYASERLCHRVRNPMTKSAALLLRIERMANETSDPELRRDLTSLYVDWQSLVERVGKVVEIDVEGTHTAWRAISLADWLKSSASRFASRFGAARLVVTGAPPACAASIRANSFLLETVFGNIWANAVQMSEEARGDGCRITVELGIDGTWLELLVYDDGPGFSEKLMETAFRLPFSSKSDGRGRGLLEIAEAVGRLQGSVQLVQASPDQYRIQLRLPLSNS